MGGRRGERYVLNTDVYRRQLESIRTSGFGGPPGRSPSFDTHVVWKSRVNKRSCDCKYTCIPPQEAQERRHPEMKPVAEQEPLLETAIEVVIPAPLH